MSIFELIKKVKNHTFHMVEGLFREAESNRMKIIWLSSALFAWAVIYGVNHPSETSSTAITVTGSVFGLVVGFYVGSNAVTYIKGNTPSVGIPKDKLDPDSQSD